MRVLFLTGRETGYPRNDVLLRAFRRFADVTVFAPENSGSLVKHSLRVSFRSLVTLIKGDYDLVFVGFYGYLLMLPVRLFSHSSILFDAFVSNYDTLCFDRQVFKPNSIGGRLAYMLDRAACTAAHLVLLDTQEHIRYFQEDLSLGDKAFSALPVGCNDELFVPKPQPEHSTTNVLYYSNFLPLHGVEHVVRAAHLLRDTRIRFTVIGMGQEYPKVNELAKQLDIPNIRWIPSVPLEALPQEIAAADICLGGHFGQSRKADRVIPGKIYQMLAVGRAVIAGDTAANRELLQHRKTALLCPPGNPERLAACIEELYHDQKLREALAQAGRALYVERCSEAVITQILEQIVSRFMRKC